MSVNFRYLVQIFALLKLYVVVFGKDIPHNDVHRKRGRRRLRVNSTSLAPSYIEDNSVHIEDIVSGKIETNDAMPTSIGLKPNMEEAKVAVSLGAIEGNVTEAVGQERRLGSVDVQGLLDLHNNFRSITALGRTNNVMAKDMTKLKWNNNLANRAVNWAKQCRFAHLDNGDDGENLYAKLGYGVENFASLQEGLQSWYDEHELHDFDSPDTSRWSQWGHYGQMVSSKTLEVGCGYAICHGSKFGYPQYSQAAMLVCRYAPMWDVNRLYKKADSAFDIATDCPVADTVYVGNSRTGLCVPTTSSGGGGGGGSNNGGDSSSTESSESSDVSGGSCSSMVSLKVTVKSEDVGGSTFLRSNEYDAAFLVKDSSGREKLKAQFEPISYVSGTTYTYTASIPRCQVFTFRIFLGYNKNGRRNAVIDWYTVEVDGNQKVSGKGSQYNGDWKTVSFNSN